jgi:hypothetical protein
MGFNSGLKWLKYYSRVIMNSYIRSMEGFFVEIEAGDVNCQYKKNCVFWEGGCN